MPNYLACSPNSNINAFLFIFFSEKSAETCFQEKFTDKEGGNINGSQTFPAVSLLDCQNKCLEMNETCKSLSHYSLDSGVYMCIIYDVVILEIDLLNNTGRTHYNRNCPTGKKPPFFSMSPPFLFLSPPFLFLRPKFWSESSFTSIVCLQVNKGSGESGHCPGSLEP